MPKEGANALCENRQHICEKCQIGYWQIKIPAVAFSSPVILTVRCCASLWPTSQAYHWIPVCRPLGSLLNTQYSRLTTQETV